MPVKQTYKVSDIEKRLKLLNMQLYGKSSEQSKTTQNTKESANLTYRNSDITGTPSHAESFRTDLTYLTQDLRKILILASLAIGVQLILYFSKLPGKIKLF